MRPSRSWAEGDRGCREGTGAAKGQDENGKEKDFDDIAGQKMLFEGFKMRLDTGTAGEVVWWCLNGNDETWNLESR